MPSPASITIEARSSRRNPRAERGRSRRPSAAKSMTRSAPSSRQIRSVARVNSSCGSIPAAGRSKDLLHDGQTLPARAGRLRGVTKRRPELRGPSRSALAQEIAQRFEGPARFASAASSGRGSGSPECLADHDRPHTVARIQLSPSRASAGRLSRPASRLQRANIADQRPAVLLGEMLPRGHGAAAIGDLPEQLAVALVLHALRGPVGRLRVERDGRGPSPLPFAP